MSKVKVVLTTTYVFNVQNVAEYFTVNVDTLWRRVVNVLHGKSGDQILTDDAVEGPAFVTPCHFLSHGRQEALRVEEAGHPEDL